MDKGKLRYLAISLGAALLALGAYTKVEIPEYWVGVAAIYAVAGIDIVKHRND